MCQKSFRINNKSNVKKKIKKKSGFKKRRVSPSGWLKVIYPSLPTSPRSLPTSCPPAEAVALPFIFHFFVGGEGTYPSSANMGSRQSLVLRSVRFAVVLGALQLHLQPLHADLEAVHRLDGCLCRHWIVIADEACRGQQTQG